MLYKVIRPHQLSVWKGRELVEILLQSLKSLFVLVCPSKFLPFFENFEKENAFVNGFRDKTAYGYPSPNKALRLLKLWRDLISSNALIFSRLAY